MYTVNFVLIALTLFVAATASAQEPASSPITPIKPDPVALYDSCMKLETPRMKKKIEDEGKTEDPRIVAHYICIFYKNICTEKPLGNSCQNGIRKYLPLKDPG